MFGNKHTQKANEHLAKANRRGGDHDYHLAAAQTHSKLANLPDSKAKRQAEEHLTKAGRRGGDHDFHMKAANAYAEQAKSQGKK